VIFSGDTPYYSKTMLYCVKKAWKHGLNSRMSGMPADLRILMLKQNDAKNSFPVIFSPLNLADP